MHSSKSTTSPEDASSDMEDAATDDAKIIEMDEFLLNFFHGMCNLIHF